MPNGFPGRVRVYRVLDAAVDYVTIMLSSIIAIVLAAVAVLPLIPEAPEAKTPVIVDSGPRGEQLVQVPVSAPAIDAGCRTTGVWTNKNGDTWTFTRCGGTSTVHRTGGPLGDCSRSHPVGSAWNGPETDCAYNGPI